MNAPPSAMASTAASLPVRERIISLEDSAIREIAHAGMGDPAVMPLWFGEPDISTPDFINQAAFQAMRDGHTFYTPNSGVPALREAIAGYTGRLYNLRVNVERITVTAAGMNGMMLLAQGLIDPGDNMVVLCPVWPNFIRCVEIMDGMPKLVPLQPRDMGWQLDLDALFDACDARTRAIYVTSPNNPTGWMMRQDEQRAVLDFCRSRGIWVIADEVYARIVYDRPYAPSFLEIADPDDLLIVVNSFSKSWAMTGWRLGWLTAPRSMELTLAKLNEYNVASPGTPTQYAGITAIKDGEPFITSMVDRYHLARDMVTQRLNALERVRMPRPEAAFYAFFAVDGVTDSMAFAKQVLAERKIGLAPGIAFGAGGETYLRICYAKSAEFLSQALDRLAPALA